jgi:hypothetical protein
MIPLPLIVWERFIHNNYLHDSKWRMLAETCKDMYNIFQYLLAKDNYPSKRIIQIPCYDPYDEIPRDVSNFCVSCNTNPYELCLSCIKYMLDKLSTCLSHRWTLLLIVNKINKIITHGISSLRIPLIDIIKLIPKNMLIDLSIETSRSFALIDMNKHSGIAQLEQELCLVSDQLVGLNMWHIDINTNCISRVVNILPQMTCLKKLNISGNDITDVGLELLIEPLKYMTQLTSLELEATLITPIGLALLSNVFPLLINLTELNLAWLFLTDAVVLKDLLIKVPQLKSLNLSYNKLGNQGISVLASTFTSMIQLRTLKIDNNNIEDVSIIRDMIQKLTQLTSLNIGHRDFNNSTLLCGDIQRLTNLTVIDNCRITN